MEVTHNWQLQAEGGVKSARGAAAKEQLCEKAPTRLSHAHPASPATSRCTRPLAPLLDSLEQHTPGTTTMSTGPGRTPRRAKRAEWLLSPGSGALATMLMVSCTLSCGASPVPDTASPALCHSLTRAYLKPEDKMVLSPIIFQGRLISKSHVYNSMYFVSFRIFKLWKGHVPRRLLHQHVRLLFYTSTTPGMTTASPRSLPQVPDEHHSGNCSPVRFNVRAGKKYIIYMKRLSPGRYVPLAAPDELSKSIRKMVKKLTCDNCTSPPRVYDLRPSITVSEGGSVKVRCKISGSPDPQVTWLKNGLAIGSDFRFDIRTKRKRSTLQISDVHRRDMGRYTCRAQNALGEHFQIVSINVRYSVPDPPASRCPIESFCLNGGKCLYYELIGELVCRCTEGFAGQRCQFKKAKINLPNVENEACGPYGHDVHLREVCAAWKRPPVTEMTREEYEAWLQVDRQLSDLRKVRQLEQMNTFRAMSKAHVPDDHEKG